MRSFGAIVILCCLIAVPAVGAAPRDAPVTLAVLNFSNRNPGDGWDWLEKGLADMLITDLGASARLTVVERERMQELFDEIALRRSGTMDARMAQRAGRLLRVGSVLTGTFAVRDGVLEIEAHVVHIESASVRRAEVVKGAPAEVFRLEKQLALRFVTGFDLPLTAKERAALMRIPTQSVDAGRAFYDAVDLYDRGQYEDALARLRASAATDPAYAQAAHWVGLVYGQLGEYTHAATALDDVLRGTPDDPWAGDSAFLLGRICEQNLGDVDRAMAAYSTLVTRFPEHRLAADGWRCLGGLHERRGQWVEAFQAFERTSDGDMRHRKYLYAKVLAECGDVVEPPRYVETLSPDRLTITRKPPWRHIGQEMPFKAPKGFQINRIVLETSGTPRKDAAPPKGFTAGIRLYVNCFYAGRSPGGFTLETSKQRSGSFTAIPDPGTRIVTLMFNPAWADAEYWKARFELAPFDPNVPQPDLKPPAPKATYPSFSESVRIEIAQGGYEPHLAQDRRGRLWAVCNNIGQYGYYPWHRTGHDADLWLMSSEDGKEWSVPSRLPVNSSASDYSPRLMVDRDDRLWLVWASSRGFDGRHHLWVSSSRDGKRWTRARKIALQRDWSMFGLPRLLQHDDGTYRLVFAATKLPTYVTAGGNDEKPERVMSSGGYSLLCTAVSKDMVTWSTPAIIPRESPEGRGFVDLCVLKDDDGVLRIVTGGNFRGFELTTLRKDGTASAERFMPELRCGSPNLYRFGGAYHLMYASASAGMVLATSPDFSHWTHRPGRVWRYATTTTWIPLKDAHFCGVTAGRSSQRRDLYVRLFPRPLPEPTLRKPVPVPKASANDTRWSGVKYTGRVVDGRTNEPYAGAMVFGMHAKGHSLAAISDEEWKRILETRPTSLADPALKPFQRISWRPATITYTDKNGVYRLDQPTGKRIYGVVACGPGVIPVRRHTENMEVGAGRMIAVPDLALFPGARLFLRLGEHPPVTRTTSAGRTFPSVLRFYPWWDVDTKDSPPWVRALLAFKTPEQDFYYCESIGSKEYTPVFIPADTRVRLVFRLHSMRDYCIPSHLSWVKLAQGETRVFDRIPVLPALVLPVHVVGEDGKPVQNVKVPISRIYDGEDGWNMATISDDQATVRLHLARNTRGRIGVPHLHWRAAGGEEQPPWVRFEVGDAIADNQKIVLKLTDAEVAQLRNLLKGDLLHKPWKAFH